MCRNRVVEVPAFVSIELTVHACVNTRAEHRRGEIDCLSGVNCLFAVGYLHREQISFSDRNPFVVADFCYIS